MILSDHIDPVIWSRSMIMSDHVDLSIAQQFYSAMILSIIIA